MERKIITSHIFPPIPMRQFDWCAYFDGEEEAGNYGYGRTEAEAIEDLLADTRADDCCPVTGFDCLTCGDTSCRLLAKMEAP